ncbi:hypothetical protein PIB30_004000 [Stylosanthes scabra]|uniref:Uncharacterized protein n=1 Tax=Stylosanthes scabra TaxID=79078 RepID=A0ABU6W3U1_9FABA|nr:hypothetical protein [Stylosanthes scabra]
MLTSMRFLAAATARKSHIQPHLKSVATDTFLRRFTSDNGEPKGTATFLSNFRSSFGCGAGENGSKGNNPDLYHKARLVRSLISQNTPPWEKVILFTRTRDDADQLTHFLARTVECEVSGLASEVFALTRFINGHLNVLVASDDFALDDGGLDIPNADISRSRRRHSLHHRVSPSFSSSNAVGELRQFSGLTGFSKGRATDTFLQRFTSIDGGEPKGRASFLSNIRSSLGCGSAGTNGAKGNSPELYHKARLVRRLISLNTPQWEKVIVFTRTRDDADRLTHFLARTVECEVFALPRFANGHFKVLVASDDDFASDDDELDIPNADIVIHFNIPSSSEIFVRRSRMTGSSVDNLVVYKEEDEDEIGAVRAIERDVGDHAFLYYISYPPGYNYKWAVFVVDTCYTYFLQVIRSFGSK